MTSIANDAVQSLSDSKITVKRIIIGSVMVIVTATAKVTQ